MTERIKKRVKEIWAHQGFQRYFKNTGWMFFGQMFSLAVSFFIGAWLARYLGPENYGIFNYAIAFVGLFGFIAPLGVDAILSRDLVAYPEKRDELLGTAFGLKLIGGFIAFLAASVAAYFLEADYLVRWIVVIFSLNFIFLSFNTVAYFFNSQVESKKNIKVQIFSTFISALLKIVLIILNLGILWLALVFLIEAIVQGFGFLMSYKNNNLAFRNWKFNRVLALNTLQNSWLLMLASAATFIYLKIDQVMIGRMMGATEVGLYAAAVKMADVWYFIPGIICSSLFPAIINAKKNNEELYRNRLKNLYWLMFFVSFFIALPISLLSNFLITWIFGYEYIKAAGVLSIYVWAGIGFFLSMAINQYLMSENKLKTIFILSLVTMIVNVVLNLYFIPLFGLNGAASATLISYLILPLFVLVYDKYFNRK